MNKTLYERVIMVVEDQPFQRKALMQQIRGLGYGNLLEAQDGQEALALCQHHSVDILLCDLRMPGMDGMALLRRLSLMEFEGGIILYSALNDDVVNAVLRMSQVYGLQVLGRLSKPASPQLIQRLIDAWQPRQEPARQVPIQHGHGRSLTADELSQALEQDQLLPWYQPKVNFNTGQWAGVEALARWQHPEYGLVSPAQFIPLAEQHGLIDRLTEVIISKALYDSHLWKKSGLSLNLSLNLSSCSLIETDLCSILLNHCQRLEINPECITLEVTESAFIKDLGQSLEVLTRLRMHGFGLAIDDFGTGYSSMQQLALLPFTELKLDRSFVDHCCQEPSRLAIIESSIDLARKLGLKIVAEGIEDETTWRQLAGLGCDLCQGFFSARPMPQAELMQWHAGWLERVPALLATEPRSS